MAKDIKDVSGIEEGSVLSPASAEKRTLLFQRIALLNYQRMEPVFGEEVVRRGVHQAFLREMAACVQEIIGENPTAEILAAAKADFFHFLSNGNNLQMLEQVYTKMLENIIIRDKKEVLTPIDLASPDRSVNSIIESVRNAFPGSRGYGGGH